MGCGLAANDYGNDGYSDNENLQIEIDLHAVPKHEYL